MDMHSFSPRQQSWGPQYQGQCPQQLVSLQALSEPASPTLPQASRSSLYTVAGQAQEPMPCPSDGNEGALIRVWSITSDMDVLEDTDVLEDNRLAAPCSYHDEAAREAREWEELLQGITSGAWQSWQQDCSDTNSVFSCQAGLEFDSGQLMLVANANESGSYRTAVSGLPAEGGRHSVTAAS